MIGCRTIVYAATVALSSAAGWVARAPAPAAVGVPTAPAARQPTPWSPVVDSTPLIAVASDGNVTLRVEQQPLEWVLEQIAAQSGWADVKALARPAAAAAAGSTPREPASVPCAEPAAPRVDAARALHAIERGSEADRLQALMQARSDGLLVDERTLKTLYETDYSERVRVAAFESYLEWRADRPGALREALEAALYVPSAAIQREAKERLAERREMERIDALSVQGVP